MHSATFGLELRIPCRHPQTNTHRATYRMPVPKYFAKDIAPCFPTWGAPWFPVTKYEKPEEHALTETSHEMSVPHGKT